MRIVLLSLLGLLYLVVPALAHDSRPLVLSISQQREDVYLVQRTVPPTVPPFNLPRIDLPAGCAPLAASQGTGPAAGDRALYRCVPDIAGREITVSYPMFNPSLSTMVQITWLSGERRSIVVPPDQMHVVVPDPETPQGVSGQYFRLGVEHILIGYDHLLFLACLLLIAGTGRRILLTITGFTLAHSVTLALSALQLVRVPVPPVEAVIALSIVFLATEIARPRRDTLTWRYPILVSSAFGLVHGFGFAAVLGEIGMPQTQVPLALLFFNLGVEGGQLLFIAAMLPIILFLDWLVRRRKADAATLAAMERPVAYAIGILAAYWMFDCVWVFVV